MVTVLANGALQALEPIFALGSAIAVVAGVVLVLFIGAPGLALLAAARPDGKIRNAPYFWLLPSIACTAFLGYSLINGDPEAFLSWATLLEMPYAIWAIAVGLGGLAHVLVHAGRFLTAPAKPLPRWEVKASKFIYGFAAIPAGALLLVSSAIKGAIPMAAYAVIVIAVGVVILRTDFERKTTRWASTLTGRRFRRMLGSVGVAILVPGSVAWTALLVSMEFTAEGGQGLLLLVLFVALPWVLAVGAGVLFHGSRPPEDAALEHGEDNERREPGAAALGAGEFSAA